MESILIQNFKAIKNTAKREIKVANLTILMGEQATGKSTVAKLVYFFKRLPEEILFSLLKIPEVFNENFENKLQDSIKDIFGKLFDISYITNDFYIKYIYDSGLVIEISQSNSNINLNYSDKNFIRSIKEKWLPVYNTTMLLADDYDQSYYSENERSIIQFAKRIGSIFGHNQNVLYVPASRNIVVVLENILLEIFSKINKSNILQNNYSASENEYIISNYIKHVQNLKNRFKGRGFGENIHRQKNIQVTLGEEIKERIEKILVGRYQNTDSGEKLFFSNSNDYVLIENSSSGQQEIIRVVQDIFLEILDNRTIFRVYEEPESHLSPAGQLGTIQLIAMLANQNTHNQVIIPTHTPYLLREIDNMLKAARIVKEHPELKDEVSKILKPYYWLESDSLSVYQLTREGEIEDAIDPEFGGVNTGIFDEVSNKISDEFDQLLNLQYNDQ